MSEPYLGEIDSFGFNFAPRNWIRCEGQILPINQNQSLYSLLGTTYGGDGRTSFAVPDLRGRVALHQGQGTGLSNRPIGQKGGEESHTLSVAEIPSHKHSASGNNGEASAASPGGHVPAPTATPIYGNSANQAMNADMIGLTGGGQSHPNMEPYLVINWCICTNGLFPPRN